MPFFSSSTTLLSQCHSSRHPPPCFHNATLLVNRHPTFIMPLFSSLNNSLPSKYYFEQKHNVPLDIRHPLLNNSLPSKHLLRPFANFLYRDIESTSRLLPLSLLGRHPLIQNLTRLVSFLTTTLGKTILYYH